MDNHDHEENKVEPWKRAPVQATLVSVARKFEFLTSYLKPVIKPHDMEKNMSAT